jgi:hypothetical protein
MSESLARFAEVLAAEVEEAVEGGGGAIYSEEEFTRILLERLGDEAALDNPTLLYASGNVGQTKYRITGFSIPDTDDRVLLTTTVHTGEVPPRYLSREEARRAVLEAVNFYRLSCQELHQRIEPANTEALDLARRIYDLKDKIDVLRVVLLSDANAPLDTADVRDAQNGTRILVDLYGIERLERILAQGLTRDDIILDASTVTGAALPCIKVDTNSDYEAYLTGLPAVLLADLYEKYSTRLLEFNVRAFLGVRGRNSVNAGLRRTLQEEPYRFFAYNNGIVATADLVEVERIGDDGIGMRRLKGFQIVNGGQTTASLYRARKMDRTNLEGILVPAKIIVVQTGKLDTMVVSVSRAANSQNTVQPADFSANNPFHIAVETLANSTWLPDQSGRWFYERARGSYSAAELVAGAHALGRRRFSRETPKARRFSKTDLAKYLNAWDGLPHAVSRGSQKNFQAFMQALREDESDRSLPDRAWYEAFVAKALLFRETQAIVRALKFPAYQANITAYTVALISMKTQGVLDFHRIWTDQAISSEMRSMIQEWARVVDLELRRSAGARMLSEWAKKVDCWEAIQKITLKFPNPLPPEISSPVGEREVVINANGESPPVEDIDHDELISMVRPLFSDGAEYERDTAITKLASQIGLERPNSPIRAEIDSVLRCAVERGILESSGDVLQLAARSIQQYSRDDLKTQFLASLPTSAWIDRDDAIRAFARWLGFRRTGSAIDESTRSIISGLLRENRLERSGSKIRRLAIGNNDTQTSTVIQLHVN